MNIFNFFIGLTLLTLGRNLFWLFVGCIGFAAGFYYTPQLLHIRSDLILLFLAVVIGITAAILAIFFQKVAIGLAGFAAGSYIAVNILNLFGLKIDQFIWLPHILGGIIGMLVLFIMFDWALIFLSSFTGASLIVQVVNLNTQIKFGLFFVLIIVGIFIQTIFFVKGKSTRGNN